MKLSIRLEFFNPKSRQFAQRGTPLRVRSPLRRETLLHGCLTARDWLQNRITIPVDRLDSRL